MNFFCPLQQNFNWELEKKIKTDYFFSLIVMTIDNCFLWVEEIKRFGVIFPGSESLLYIQFLLLLQNSNFEKPLLCNSKYKKK